MKLCNTNPWWLSIEVTNDYRFRIAVKSKKCSFYHSRMVAITKHIFRHVYPYTHTHTLGCTHVYIRLFKPIQQPWWYKNKCKRILFFIMLAQNTTWISLLLFLETTSPYKHDGSLRFCVPFQFETHGRYHSSSMLTVFLKLLFRQYILWCDGYQVSYLRMFVLYPVWSLLATLYAFLLWGLSSLWLFIHRSLSYGLYSRSCSYCRLLLLYRKWC